MPCSGSYREDSLIFLQRDSTVTGSFDCVAAGFASGDFAQDDKPTPVILSGAGWFAKRPAESKDPDAGCAEKWTRADVLMLLSKAKKSKSPFDAMNDRTPDTIALGTNSGLGHYHSIHLASRYGGGHRLLRDELRLIPLGRVPTG